MKSLLKLVLVTLFSAAAATSAVAQMGAKPVTLVVPYGAGGTSDIMARIMSAKMQTVMPHPVIADNKPGAGGRLAVGLVKNMAADGSVVLVGLPAPIVVAPHLYPKLNYDIDKDYTPVAKIAKTGFSIAVSATSPIKSLADLIDQAKTNPGKLNYGVAGVGTIPHFIGSLLAKNKSLEWNMVPYKGGTEMTTDLVGGHIDVAIDLVPDHVEQFKAGKIRILAVVGQNRFAQLPEIPTLAELDVPGIEFENWQGLFVPKKTPAASVQELQQAVEKSLADPAVKQQLAKVGLEADFQNSATFAEFVKAESRKWSTVVRESKIVVE